MGYNLLPGGIRKSKVSDAFDSIVGKAVIERGWVTREQLVECIRECASTPGDPASSDSGSKLTSVLVKRGLVKPDQMASLQEEVSKIIESDADFEVVRRNDTSLGTLLVKGGHCSKERLVEALSLQQVAASRGEVPPRLGEILLQKGYVTFGVLEQVLGLQKGKTALSCSLCGASYGVVDYNPGRKYLCKKCTGPLLPAAQASSDIPPEVLQARTNPKNVLSKYVVVKELGRGGMGAVYKAWDTQLKRWCAVKVLVGTGAKDEVARFRREAQTAAALRHSNIVGIYEVGDVDDKHLIAMEFIEGSTLAGVRLPALKAAELLAVVARAVDYAHSKGVIHRDLKPHNVMLDPEGRPFVMDFGLAKSIDGPSHLTVQGTVVGTPSYMAPEQAEGKSSQVDRRSDVYSLGAVLYETLTGRPPFKGANPVETLRMVVNEDPLPPSRFNPAVLKDLETIVLKCLDKDRERRYPTAKALAEDLERFARGGAIAAKRASMATRVGRQVKRKSGTVAAVLAGVAAVALTLVLVLSGSGKTKEIRALLAQAEALERQGDVDGALHRYEAAAALERSERLKAKTAELRERKRKAAEESATRSAAEKKRREEARAKAQPEIDQGRSKAQRARTSLYQPGADFGRSDQLLQEAIAHFGRAVDVLPDPAEALHLRGQAHALRRNFAAAEKDFTAALKALETFSAAYYDRGRVWLELAAEAQGQLKVREGAAQEEAKALLEKAKADFDAFRRIGGGDPEQTEFAEALLAASEMNYEKVVRICDDLIARKTSNEEVWKLKGDASMHVGDKRDARGRDAAYQEAVRAYTDAITKRANYPDAYIGRGHMLFHLGKMDEALKDLAKSVDCDRPQPDWYAQRAAIYHEMGRGADALADYEKALAMKPDDLGLRRNLGWLCVQQGQFSRALEIYERLLKAAPDSSDALAGRGSARLGLRDHAGALADLEAARAKAHRSWRVPVRIATIYLARGEFLKGEEELSRYLKGEPNADDAQLLRARCRAQLGRAEEAAADCRAVAARGGPRAPEAQQLLEELTRR